MNEDTLLYRQIPECYIKPDGHVASLAFRPMPKDHNMLSVYDGDLITPKKAFLHFTEELNCSSVGILSVSGAECITENLPFQEDYTTHPYHALIDFSGKGNACRRISEHLRNAALKRGWLYQE